MSYDCVDICDEVVQKLCVPCPQYKYCHSADEANHSQMIDCMNRLIALPNPTLYPARDAIENPLGENTEPQTEL